ncbi:tetratricopeptide repeat-containing sulfotransferase family protein [Marinibacterium profundimaris]|uniref:Uncharacterized protein n=1 Tax=Marinibacterium profundimaris TaxID=1679460 RepID=A0A225NFD5_9RHOB|nr:tetratricopeptide repeat-containing sulfotransferase family protein [Marinibacterium profundimaris]OWU71675.1 hypothetical protein ATO3_17885 [Marinibacterium profundimaris]
MTSAKASSGKSVARQLADAKTAAKRGDPVRAREIYVEILAAYPGNRKAQAALAALDRAGVAADASPGQGSAGQTSAGQGAAGQGHADQGPGIATGSAFGASGTGSLISATAAPAGRQGTDHLQWIYALYHKKQFSKALLAAEGILEDDPTCKPTRELRAACLRMLDRPEEALTIYRERLEEDAADAGLWQNCGSTLIEMLRLKEAEECLRMATRIAPDSLPGWMLLANCHQRMGDGPAAYEALTQALGRDPGNSRALDQLGQVLRDMGRSDMALGAHEQALRHAGSARERSQILTNIGVICSASGDRSAARDRYRAALAEQSDNVHALLNLVTLAHEGDTDDLVRRTRKLLRKETLQLQDRSKANFAMFRLLDRIGTDPARAYDHLERANAERRELIQYSPANQDALFRAIRRMSDDTPDITGVTEGVRPVFIVGLPRSGTTLTEQMLSAAPGAHAAGELTMVERLSLDIMRWLEAEQRPAPLAEEMAHYATELRSGLTAVAGGAPVVLDKMPLNFRWVGLLLKALPDARVLHVRRDPVETCWSNFTTSFSSHGNGFAYGLSDLVHYHRLYSDLTAHWAQCFPDRIRTLRYEDIVDAPEPTMRGVVDWCGLEWSDDCLHPETVDRAVLTASVHQVRRKIYNGNRGRWRPYVPFIGPLLDAFDTAHAA